MQFQRNGKRFGCRASCGFSAVDDVGADDEEIVEYYFTDYRLGGCRQAPLTSRAGGSIAWKEIKFGLLDRRYAAPFVPFTRTLFGIHATHLTVQ
jgi:hypothetical protein